MLRVQQHLPLGRWRLLHVVVFVVVAVVLVFVVVVASIFMSVFIDAPWPLAAAST